MASLGRVEEKGRGPGRGEGRGNLFANDAGFSHTGNDDPSAAAAYQVNGFFKISVEFGDQVCNRCSLCL